MQIADCDVMIGKYKDTVPRTDVTPAEVQYLIHEHQNTVGQCPVINLVIKEGKARVNLHNADGSIRGSRDRTSLDEKSRLKTIYDSNPVMEKNKVEKMYPGTNATLPLKFSEVVDKEGNYPYADDGKLVAGQPDGSVQIGGEKYSEEELKQLVAAGKAALKIVPASKGPGQNPTETAEEDDV